jgi:hypothetical protein
MCASHAPLLIAGRRFSGLRDMQTECPGACVAEVAAQRAQVNDAQRLG